MVFFCRLGYRRMVPQGLNWVARVRLEYRPPETEPRLVMSQILAIVLRFVCYHKPRNYSNPKSKILISKRLELVFWCFEFVWKLVLRI